MNIPYYPVKRVGKVRKELAKILSDHLGIEVDPALLKQNYEDYFEGRNYGWAYSWYYNTYDRDHPLYNHGSCETMTDFIELYKQGYQIVLRKEEICLYRPDYKNHKSDAGSLHLRIEM